MVFQCLFQCLFFVGFVGVRGELKIGFWGGGGGVLAQREMLPGWVRVADVFTHDVVMGCDVTC